MTTRDLPAGPRWELDVTVRLDGKAAAAWAEDLRDRRNLVGVFVEDDTSAPDTVAGLLCFVEGYAEYESPFVGDRVLRSSVVSRGCIRATGWTSERTCHGAHTAALRMIHELIPQPHHDQINATETIVARPKD